MPTPPHTLTSHYKQKKVRDSNLELYRIIVMLLIIAHHYVVNSGLIDILRDTPLTVSSLTMILFGAWGKTGINCFILITGYFMCRSIFTWNKLLKLYLQILFYAIIIYVIFCITGHERLSAVNILWKIWPVHSIDDGFTSCFLLFYIFIPFLNIFINSLDRKRHLTLVILLLLVFSLLPTVPVIKMKFNYVGWFMVLYLIGAYLQLHDLGGKIKHGTWGWLTIVLICMASISVLGMTYGYKSCKVPQFAPYFFIADSNKILSLSIAISSFMYFKDLKIPHSRMINVIGGATFGVFLIHANSNAMRQWLWSETVDCMGNYKDDLVWTLGYAVGCVLLIFIVCAGIDWFRVRFIEPKLMDGLTKLLSPITSKLNK